MEFTTHAIEYSEAVAIEGQAQAHLLNGGKNLLPAAAGHPASEKQTKEAKT